jgi:hypothetical protein
MNREVTFRFTDGYYFVMSDIAPARVDTWMKALVDGHSFLIEHDRGRYLVNPKNITFVNDKEYKGWGI